MINLLPSAELKKILGISLDFLFPAECTFCKQFLGDERFLIFCKGCWEKVELIKDSICSCCGKPFESKNSFESAPNFLCGRCREGFYHFDKARAIGKYEGVLKEAIHQFKYKATWTGKGKPRLGRHLSEWLADHLSSDLKLSSFDLIIPIPLHKNRKRWRGFNQSEVLAKFLGQRYRVPLNTFHLYRGKETRPQIELSGDERTQNVQGAFGIRDAKELEGKKIILVDDVFTTGATVNESSRVLKKAEVKEILVLTLARV
jgi:ComF family protein